MSQLFSPSLAALRYSINHFYGAFMIYVDDSACRC